MRQLIVALGLLLVTGSAQAVESCVLSTQDLNLGTYVWTQHSPAQHLVSAHVECTADTPQNVTISAKLPVFAAGGLRTLSGPGGDLLRYRLEIRSEATGTDQPWGDGSGGSVIFTKTLNTLTEPGVDLIPTLTIIDGQQVRSGSYSDNLVITVSIVVP